MSHTEFNYCDFRLSFVHIKVPRVFCFFLNDEVIHSDIYPPFRDNILLVVKRQKALTTSHLCTQLDPFASKLMIYASTMIGFTSGSAHAILGISIMSSVQFIMHS